MEKHCFISLTQTSYWTQIPNIVEYGLEKSIKTLNKFTL